MSFEFRFVRGCEAVKVDEKLIRSCGLDVKPDSMPSPEEMKRLKKAAGDGVDVFCVPSQFIPKLALFDMDSTIVAAETLDEMAEMAGYGAEVKEITRRAMVEGADFDTSLRRRLVKLKGVDAGSLLQPVYEDMKLNEGAEVLIQGLKDHGVKIVLVSGGFTFFTEKVSSRLNMDAHHGNVLEIDDEGLLTGRVINDADIVNGNKKAEHLAYYAQQYGADLSECLCVGDGSNDLPMMKRAGLGVGYKPAPGGKVEQEMSNVIRDGNLATLLKVIGF